MCRDMFTGRFFCCLDLYTWKMPQSQNYWHFTKMMVYSEHLYKETDSLWGWRFVSWINISECWPRCFSKHKRGTLSASQTSALPTCCQCWVISFWNTLYFQFSVQMFLIAYSLHNNTRLRLKGLQVWQQQCQEKERADMALIWGTPAEWWPLFVQNIFGA